MPHHVFQFLILRFFLETESSHLRPPAGRERPFGQVPGIRPPRPPLGSMSFLRLSSWPRRNLPHVDDYRRRCQNLSSHHGARVYTGLLHYRQFAVPSDLTNHRGHNPDPVFPRPLNLSSARRRISSILPTAPAAASPEDLASNRVYGALALLPSFPFPGAESQQDASTTVRALGEWPRRRISFLCMPGSQAMLRYCQYRPMSCGIPGIS